MNSVILNLGWEARVVDNGTKSYSIEFRIAVAKAYDECESSIEVAEMFNCSASWVLWTKYRCVMFEVE